MPLLEAVLDGASLADVRPVVELLEKRTTGKERLYTFDIGTSRRRHWRLDTDAALRRWATATGLTPPEWDGKGSSPWLSWWQAGGRTAAATVAAPDPADR